MPDTPTKNAMTPIESFANVTFPGKNRIKISIKHKSKKLNKRMYHTTCTYIATTLIFLNMKITAVLFESRHGESIEWVTFTKILSISRIAW